MSSNKPGQAMYFLPCPAKDHSTTASGRQNELTKLLFRLSLPQRCLDPDSGSDNNLSDPWTQSVGPELPDPSVLGSQPQSSIFAIILRIKTALSGKETAWVFPWSIFGAPAVLQRFWILWFVAPTCPVQIFTRREGWSGLLEDAC